MKKYPLALLLSTAPLFAGVAPAPVAPAPPPECAPGFTLSLEALALRPFQSDGNYNENNYKFGYRASLGYDFNNCLFTKLTYFGWNNDVYDENYNYGSDHYHDTGDFKATYLDWVIGQNFKPGENFRLSPFVGLRWGTVDRHYNSHGSGTNGWFDNEKDSAEFSGLGIVVGIDATRSFGSGFSLYGTFKQSLLFGTSDNSWSDKWGYPNEMSHNHGSYSDNCLVSVTELGLGLQYDFTFSNVAANVRLGVEAQYWGGLDSSEWINSGNSGLAGFVLGANFRF